ncbi:MAG: hypothetical protein WA581_10275 [Candidatus Acidiferrales bacterium]
MSFNEVRISGLLWDVQAGGDGRHSYGTALLEIHNGTVPIFYDSIKLMNQFTSFKAGSEIVVQGSLAIFDGSPQINVSSAWIIPHGGVKELGLNRMVISSV